MPKQIGNEMSVQMSMLEGVSFYNFLEVGGGGRYFSVSVFISEVNFNRNVTYGTCSGNFKKGFNRDIGYHLKG